MNIDALAAGAGAVIRAEVPTMTIMDNPLILPQPPAWTLFDFTVNTHATQRFASEAMLTFRVIVGVQDPESGATLTRNLASDGPGTPFYAIEKPHILGTGAQTFGGACDDAAVTVMRGYRLYPYGNIQFIGFELVVKAVGERAS